MRELPASHSVLHMEAHEPTGKTSWNPDQPPPASKCPCHCHGTRVQQRPPSIQEGWAGSGGCRESETGSPHFCYESPARTVGSATTAAWAPRRREELLPKQGAGRPAGRGGHVGGILMRRKHKSSSHTVKMLSWDHLSEQNTWKCLHEFARTT